MSQTTSYQTTPRSLQGGSTDAAEMAALLELGLSQQQLLALKPLLANLETLFGADLPDDIEITPAGTHNPVLQPMAFTSS